MHLRFIIIYVQFEILQCLELNYLKENKMFDIADEYVHEVSSKIASQCTLKDWSHRRQTFETIAQNYFGVLIPLTIEGKRDGKCITLHLVLKLAPPSEKYRVSGAVTLMFAREIFVYSELLQKYQELQDKLPLQHQYNIMPRCFYVCKEYCKEAIAMQNMCGEGYSPYTKSAFLDLDHIMTALKSLAKLHALSFILKENDPILYDKAKSVCIPLTNNSNSRFIGILIDRLTKALLKFENTKYIPLLEVLKTKCNYFIESAIYRVKNICISHGDMWKENILFKFKDNVPISACIIDYQTVRMSTPAFDVLYLLLSSVDTTLRQKHFNELIDAYYETFRQCLLSSNLDSKLFYTKDDLEYDLQIVGPACLIVVNTAIWLASGLQEEGHVRSKYQPSTDEERANAVNQYKSIIKGIIDDLNSYRYLRGTEFVAE